jgi:putative oxidoreductase
MARRDTTDIGLLVLRIGMAALLIGFHGWARLIRAFEYAVMGQPWTFVNLVQRLGFPYPPVFAVASALAESIAALLIGLGLFTRTGAVILVANMSVAFYNEAAKGDSFELPGLYLLLALVVLIAGPGRFTIRRPTSRSSSGRAA